MIALPLEAKWPTPHLIDTQIVGFEAELIWLGGISYFLLAFTT